LVYVSQQNTDEFKDRVVNIGRVTKVVKGGKNFSFNAVVVVGDENGRVGYGLGKALEVPAAIRKGVQKAKKSLMNVTVINNTIPYEVWGVYGAARVMLRPAKPGTGVIAGATVRAVVESAGIKDIVTKCYGSTNPQNVVKATFDALSQLMQPERLMAMRFGKVTESGDKK
jgi:small subunit ribosomal protein S5